MEQKLEPGIVGNHLQMVIFKQTQNKHKTWKKKKKKYTKFRNYF